MLAVVFPFFFPLYLPTTAELIAARLAKRELLFTQRAETTSSLLASVVILSFALVLLSFDCLDGSLWLTGWFIFTENKEDLGLSKVTCCIDSQILFYLCFLYNSRQGIEKYSRSTCMNSLGLFS